MPIPVCPIEINGKVIRDVKALRAKIANSPTSEKGYEATLAKLGLTVLQDRVSELMPYFRGFQLLELSEDGEFSAGFFVFEANDLIIDAPMFMIKGKMKGKELLFLRDRQMFIPSQEGLVQYLLGMRDEVLGSSGPSEYDRRNNRTTPNIDVFSRANQFMRKVSHIPFATVWGREAKVFDSYLSTHLHPKTAEIFQTVSGSKRLPSPPTEKLLRLPGMAEKLASWCELSPRLDLQVKKRFGADWQAKVAADRKRASAWMSPAPVLKPLVSRLQLAKTASASVPMVGAISHVPEYLFGEARAAAAQEVAEFGCFITDTRPLSMTKTAMAVQKADEMFSGAVESGSVRIPMRDGSTKKCLVVLARDRVQTAYSPTKETLVIAADGSGAVECNAMDLAVRHDEYEEPVRELEDWRKSMSEVGELKIPEDEVFVVIDKYGRCAGPLRSEGSGSDGELDVRPVSLRSTGRSPRSQTGEILGSAGYMMAKTCSSRVTCMRVAERGEGFSYLETDEAVVLLVPKSAKIMKLETETMDDSDCRCVKSIPVLPFSEMVDDRLPKLASFTVSMPSDSMCNLNGKSFSLKAAAMLLMRDHGLSKTAAIELFRTNRDKAGVRKYAASPSKDLQYWQLFTDMVKTADMSPPGQPSYQFDFPQEAYGQSDSTIPVTEKYPMNTSERSPVQYADENDPNWSGYLAPYEKPRETRGSAEGEQASQVAKTNESLWENTLFSSLLRNVRVDSQISQQVQMVFKEADMYGRTLFLIYAHQEQFEEVFGEKDLPEIEEQILTLFEGCGELIADLLRRGISSVGDGILMAMESA